MKFIQFNETAQSLHVPNAPTIAILVLALPLFDTLRVFTQRIASGLSPFAPDRNHIHHLVIDSGLSHLKASCLLSVLTLILVTVSFYFFANASVSYSFVGLILVFSAYSLLIRRNMIVSRPFIKRHLASKRREAA